MENKLIGQATPEQIAEWKAKHPNRKIWSYTVDGHICYLLNVDRITHSRAVAEITKGGIGAMNKMIVDMIWLGGSDFAKKDDGAYFGLSEKVEELMGKKMGELGEC